MTMSNWIYTLKTILKCKRFTSNRMREIILEECLVCKQPVFGAYVVDGQKVWENVVVHDLEVMKRLRCMNIYDHIGMEGLCYSVLEQKMRVLRTKSCSKRRC